MLDIYSKYAPNANPANVNYPNGYGKDESVSGANDGTPLDMDWYNDMLGYSEALLAEAGVEPSGDADTALNSDRMDAFRIAAIRVETAVAYGVSDVSQIGVIALVTGDDVTDYTHIVDGDSLTRWSVGSVTGTFAGDFNSSTGVDSGLSGALTKIAAFGTAAYADITDSETDGDTSKAMKVGFMGYGNADGTTEAASRIDDFDDIDFSSLLNGQMLRTSTSALNAPSGVTFKDASAIVNKRNETDGTMLVNFLADRRSYLYYMASNLSASFVVAKVLTTEETASSSNINNASSDELAITPLGLAGSDVVKWSLLVPSDYTTVGDEGNATVSTDANLPDNITTASRYVLTNPFGNSSNSCECFPEILVDGIWTPLGTSRGSTSSDSVGGRVGSVYGTGIVLQTGTLGLSNQDADREYLTLTGGTTNTGINSAPCRIWIKKRGV